MQSSALAKSFSLQVKSESYATNEDVTLKVKAPGVLRNDSGTPDRLSATVARGPEHGTLALAKNGSFTYAPDKNFNGTDSFLYRVSNGGRSGTATVSAYVRVRPVNDAPDARDDRYEAAQDKALGVAPRGVLKNDFDAERHGFVARKVSNPSHGRLALRENGSFVYTPSAGYTGTDSFRYRAVEKSGKSDVATARISVFAASTETPNATPSAPDRREDLPEDGSRDIALSATDADGDDLTYEVADAPNHGSLTGTAPDLTYTPDADYNGPDAFAYAASDGKESDEGKVSLDVNPVNDAPTASNDTVSAPEGGTPAPLDIGALVSDIETSDANLDYVLTSPTGTVASTDDPSKFTFAAGEDFNGSVEVGYTVTDRGDPDNCAPGAGCAARKDASGTVTVMVEPVNDVPSFTKGPDQREVYNKDADGQPKAYTVDPWAMDVSAGANENGQALTFEVVNDDNSLFDAQPAVSSGGVLTFTPNPDKAGVATVGMRLKDDGGTDNGGDDTSELQTFTIETVEPGPAVTSVSPSPLVPGETATLTGREFSPTATQNAVTIGGADAAITGATAKTLTVKVPCVSSDDAIAVRAKVNGIDTNTVNHPLQVPQQDLGVGEAAVVDEASKVACNELASADGDARYVIAAYNTSTIPTTSAPIQMSGDTAGESSVSSARQGSMSLDADGAGAAHDHGSDVASEHESVVFTDNAPEDHAEHLELLKENREQYKKLREEFGTEGEPRMRAQNADAPTAADMPLTRNFRVSNVNSGRICNNYYVASATRVYAGGKLAIYEDDATPSDLKAANNPAMADYYEKIGNQFNSDMEPIIRDNFGDILRRDAVTDNNGVMVALSTPHLNNSFPGIAGFVVTCDQFPNDDDTSTPKPVGGPYTGSGINGASNFGEFFYMYQPRVSGSGYSDNTPDQWYRTIRSTFIHESKHVVSQAARVANNASAYEQGWLEEGTARIAEELWARESVYNVEWKGNTGYGSAEAPNSLYCDYRPESPECLANPIRPSKNMSRHFESLYSFTVGQNARFYSPFGPTQNDSSHYYAGSWSLVRYAIDRYATSDEEFLKGLTQSNSSGVTNLSQQTGGVPYQKMLGGWALALFVDDYPGLTGASKDIQMPTWNFRDIYAGIHSDNPQGFTRVYPASPTQLGFGSFGPAIVPTLRGGGVMLFEISGEQTEDQLLYLQGQGGGALPGTVRLSVTRVE